MSINLTVNGVIYRYPETGDQNWGSVTTLWAQAVTSGMLQKAGGAFALTADVDFGANFGLISEYFTSRSSDSAQSGSLRLAQGDSVSWRNAADDADLPLATDLSDNLTWNGAILLAASTSALTNANIDANAAIDYSKLAALTADRALQSSSLGVIEPSSVTSTELGYVSGVSSAIQDQLDDKLDLSGGTMTGAILLPGLPSLPNEAASKQYVDNSVMGIQAKEPVVAASVTAGTLATDFEDGDDLDGVTLATGDRILIKNQAAPEENGIYIVAASGAPSRSTDADTWDELVQAYTLVLGGDTQGGSAWICSIAPGGTIGVDPVTFFQFSSSTQYTADGQGIELSGTQFSLELDGVTLSKSASGLRLAAAQASAIAAALPNPLTTTGDIIYSSSGTTAGRLGIGSAGQVLTVSGGLPSWQSPTANPTVQAVSGTLNLVSGDSNKIFLVDTSAARTVNLPAPASGLNFTFKDKTGSCATNNITLVRNAAEKIEGVAASKILQTNWGFWKVISDGTDWFIVG